jgi:hypothetical protein
LQASQQIGIGAVQTNGRRTRDGCALFTANYSMLVLFVNK